MKNLESRLAAIVDRAAAISEEVEDLLAANELTDDEAVRFDQLEAEAGKLAEERADIEKKLEARAKVAELAKDPANLIRSDVEGPAPAHIADPFDISEVRTMGRNPVDVGNELRGRAFKVVEDERHMEDRSKEHVTRLLERSDTRDGKLARHILATGHPAYRSAWAKLVTEQHPDLTPEERTAVAAVRAMSLTDAAGGYLIPFTLDPTIILTNAGVIDPMRRISRVEVTMTDTWNGVSSAGVTASWDAEAAEVSDDAPTLAQPSITPAKAAAFVPFSIEAGQDIANLAENVADLFADAKANLEGAAFVTGTGSSQPKGVVTAAAAASTSVVSATTNNNFGLVDVYAVDDALEARHQANASWMANRAIFNDIRQFDTGGGAALWERLAGATPSLLLGSPAYENSSMDGVIGTGDDNVLIKGDFRKYCIVDRVGLAIEYIPHLFATNNNRPSGQRGLYGNSYLGGDVIDADAFRLLQV
jgi:HK97 family phage major capsid protein